MYKKSNQHKLQQVSPITSERIRKLVILTCVLLYKSHHEICPLGVSGIDDHNTMHLSVLVIRKRDKIMYFTHANVKDN